VGEKGRGWGQGGEMNQALYAHMNNKRKMKKKKGRSLADLVLQCFSFFNSLSTYKIFYLKH
jgi:hypothetical protein